MKLDVVFTPAEVETARLAERTVVVIDVLRASSTILEALINGARAVIPVETVERAVRTAAELGKAEVVLCGERGSVPIEGFPLGNSPREFTAERVAGKTLVMTSTNGTPALVAGSVGRRCLVGALLNVGEVAATLAEDEDVVLLCAGREGRFALEDAFCAGLIGRRLSDNTTLQTTDSARAAMFLASQLDKKPAALLHSTGAGQQLSALDLAEDIEFCAALDRYARVPELRDHRITL